MTFVKSQWLDAERVGALIEEELMDAGSTARRNPGKLVLTPIYAGLDRWDFVGSMQAREGALFFVTQRPTVDAVVRAVREWERAWCTASALTARWGAE